jgi:hypothetical protein
MSIANLIPALKGSGSRRAVDKVEELRAENGRLLDRQLAADDFFGLLMHDVVTTNAALAQEQQLRGEAEEAAAQMRMERDDWCEEAERLAAELAPYKAAEANDNRVDVPPMHRDTEHPADQATTPIDVRPLWVALGIGPTGAVIDPGHVPASPAEPEPAT